MSVFIARVLFLKVLLLGFYSPPQKGNLLLGNLLLGGLFCCFCLQTVHLAVAGDRQH